MKLKPKSTTLNDRALLYKRFINIESGIAIQNVYKTTDGKLWLFNIEDYKFIEMKQENLDVNSKILDVPLNSVLSYKGIGLFYNEQHGWGLFEIKQETYSNKVNFYETVAGKKTVTQTFTNAKPLIIYPNTTVDYSVNTSFTFSFKVYGKSIFGGNEELLLEKEITSGPTSSEFKGSVALSTQTQFVITKIVVSTTNTGSFPSTRRIDLTVNGSIGISQVVDGRVNNMSKYQINKYYYAGSFDFTIKGSIEGTTVQYIKGNIIPLRALNIKHFNDDVKLSTDDLVVVGGRLYSVENPETVIKQQPKPFQIHFATLNSVL